MHNITIDGVWDPSVRQPAFNVRTVTDRRPTQTATVAVAMETIAAAAVCESLLPYCDGTQSAVIVYNTLHSACVWGQKIKLYILLFVRRRNESFRLGHARTSHNPLRGIEPPIWIHIVHTSMRRDDDSRRRMCKLRKKKTKIQNENLTITEREMLWGEITSICVYEQIRTCCR